MKSLFSLMFGFSFLTKGRGDVYRFVSFLLTSSLGIVCWFCSSFTNTKGFDAIFADYPEYAQTLGSVLAWLLDPLIWVCACVVFLKIHESLHMENDEYIKARIESHKSFGKRFVATTYIIIAIFSAGTIGLGYATYKLSQFGAEKYNMDLAKEEKPEDFSSKIEKFNDKNSKQVSATAEVYKQELADLSATRKEKKAIADKKAEFARKGKWTEHKQALKAEAWLDSYDAKKEKLKKSYDKQIASLSTTASKQSAQIEKESTNAMSRFEVWQAKLIAFGTQSVNVWTICGMIVFLASCLLSSEDYSKHAVVMIKIHIEDWEEIKSDIKVDLAGSKPLTGKKVLPHTDSPIKPAETKQMPNTAKNHRNTWDFDTWLDKHPETASLVAELIDKGEFPNITEFVDLHKDLQEFTACNRADVSYMKRAYIKLLQTA